MERASETNSKMNSNEIQEVNARNRAVIDALHNRHKGGRVFIIGAGTSLDTVPDALFSKLAGEYTFGVNTVVTYDRLTFPLDFYCVSEVGWLSDSNQPFNVHKGLKESGLLPGYRFYCHPFPMHDGGEGSQFYKASRAFQEEIQDWVYVREDRDLNLQNGPFMGLGGHFRYVPGGGGSVVVFAIQLACWMGFDRVYLLGCDANQGYAAGLNWEPSEPQRRRQDNFIRAATVAEETMSRHGRELVNLAPGGNLTIGRGEVKDILGKQEE